MSNLYYTLTEEKNISDIISEIGAIANDTLNIELSGNNIILDYGCDARDYNIKITNNGNECKFVIEDLTGIHLGASLPKTVCPYVNPENPLPVETDISAHQEFFDIPENYEKFIINDPVTGQPDLYCTPYKANARCEIQLADYIGLGGGYANIQTDTRSGKCYSTVDVSTGNTIILKDDLPIHYGDIIANVFSFSTASNRYESKVISYNAKTVTLEKNNYYSRNSIVGLFSGGIFVTYTMRGGTVFTSPINTGTLNNIGYYIGAGSGDYAILTNSNICAKRLCAHMIFNTNTGSINSSGIVGSNGAIYAKQLVSFQLFALNSTGKKIAFIEDCMIKLLNSRSSDVFECNTGYIDTVNSSGIINNAIINNIQPTNNCNIHVNNSYINNELIQNKIFESSGTVTNVSRSKFNTEEYQIPDTDIPDAFLYVPTTSSDTPWKYEDMWVRNGETLRINTRAMLVETTSIASVAITEMAVWYPAPGMPSLAEWKLENSIPLEWNSGSLQWTNTTGQDKQVRVWGTATGNTSGAYISFWKASGGIL